MESMMLPSLLDEFRSAALNQLRLELDSGDMEKISRFYGLLLDANSRMNLTRIIEPSDFLLKHILDSLAVIRAAPELAGDTELNVLDLGTGGGVPGIPVAIAFPRHLYWLVDSTEKKIREVAGMVENLGMTDRCCAVQARARELVGKKHNLKNHFNLVLARAVGTPETAAEECSQLLAHDGIVVLYASESQKRAGHLQGWRQEESEPFTLKLGQDAIRRKFILLQKSHRT